MFVEKRIMLSIRKIISCAVFLFSAEFATAQDHVTLMTDEVIEGKIVENKTEFSIGAVANISVDGEKYKIMKVRSYQKGNRYMVNINNRYFLKAYIQGKINAIHVEEDAGHLSDRGFDKDYYLLQKGEDGKLVKMSWNNLEEMISDNPSVMEKFKSIEKGKQWTPGSKKEMEFLAAMKEIIDMYNK
jgi:hypothetical protein